MAQNALRDENRIPVMLFVGTDGGTYYVKGDEITGRLYVDLNGDAGDVNGPASSVNENIAVFDGITGKIIKDGAKKISELQLALGYTAENVANKSTNVATDGSSDTKYPSVKAVKDYADGLVVGLWDDRGSYDASGNVYPSTGGSGTAGAILKGDIWTVSVEGTLGGVAVNIGDTVRALVDTPGQTSTNWGMLENNIGYVPENVANKKTTMTDNTTSNIFYLSAKAIYDWATGLFQTLGNLRTSFQATPDDTHYPSEKLVKESLDAKMTNPMTTQGDIIYGGASGVTTRLEKGTAGQMLTMNDSVDSPKWAEQLYYKPDTISFPTINNFMYYDGFYADTLKVSVYLSNNQNSAIDVYNVNNPLLFESAVILGSTNQSLESAASIGQYAYVLYRKTGTTPATYYFVRYNTQNLAAGATTITFSGQSLTNVNDIIKMVTDGTYFYFSYKAGNSATAGVLSKYSLSGTTLTYIGDVTLSGVTTIYGLWAKSDGSFWAVTTGSGTSGTLEKYNSSGTKILTTGNLYFASNYTINIKDKLYYRLSDGNDRDRSYTFLLNM